MVVFDASFLIPLLDPQVKGTGDVDARLSYLIKTLEAQNEKIVVPTPALSEVLIGAGDAAPQYLEILNKSSRFRIGVFGERAAVEAAARHRESMKQGDKKEGSTSWAKVKFDRQIVAIAAVEGASRIYSNDDDIKRLGGSDQIRLSGVSFPLATVGAR